ncbi:MAG: ATP-binding cassette domain-containing protein [Actinomycetota bacterium]|nr:ATP-binding cassette domain-containing protein [Actinomycetota bacterium]
MVAGGTVTAAIEVDGLRKSFRSRAVTVEAVRGITFAVPGGTVFGLLGPNGAGKTTTLRMLTTLLPIDGGTATVAGVDVARQPATVRQRIGYVSQAGGADDLATGRENLRLQGALYGAARGQLEGRVAELVERLDLSPFADRRVRTYSGGQRRRLDVALGLVHRPQVLFLDEPTTGLDPQNRAHLWEHVRSLADDGTTVVLTTHYLEEADALCDQVVIVDHGQVVAEGTPEALKREVVGESLSLTVRDPGRLDDALGAVQAVDGVLDGTIDGAEVRLRVGDGSAVLPAVLGMLQARGVDVESVNLARPSLDDVFLARTGRSLRDAGGPRAEVAGE